jgi:signal transduction histidine kinase
MGAAARLRRRTLRRRILTATLAVSAVATVAFGVPLGVVLTRMERERTVLRLEREASEVLAQVPDEQLTGSRPFVLPAPLVRDDTRDGTRIGVYGGDGARLSGTGPAQSDLARRATLGVREQSGWENDELVVAEPLRADRPGYAAIRVAVPRDTVTEEVWESSALMAGLAVLVLAVAGGVAFALARRLTRPLESLAVDARQLGDGDFTVRPQRSHTAEIDDVGQALDATARRLGALLERERAFTADASHQIRTPLTALRLTLEAAPVTPGSDLVEVCADAVTELDRLEETVDHLLAVARDIDRPGTLVDPAALVVEVTRRWEPAFRRANRELDVELATDLPDVRASWTGLSHVLDVLLDNALEHGAGTVTVSGRSVGPGVAIDVADEGEGVTVPGEEVFRRRGDAARGHGIGLALARSLAEADGGRLELTAPGPRPTFTLLLPARAPRSTASSSSQVEFR